MGNLYSISQPFLALIFLFLGGGGGAKRAKFQVFPVENTLTDHYEILTSAQSCVWKEPYCFLQDPNKNKEGVFVEENKLYFIYYLCIMLFPTFIAEQVFQGVGLGGRVFFWSK